MPSRALLALVFAAASCGTAAAADFGGPPVVAYRTRMVVEREVLPVRRIRPAVTFLDGCACGGLPWGGLQETWVDLPWGGLPSCAPVVRRKTRVVVMRKG